MSLIVPGIYVTPNTDTAARLLTKRGKYASKAEAIEDALRFALLAAFGERAAGGGIRLVDIYKERLERLKESEGGDAKPVGS